MLNDLRDILSAGYWKVIVMLVVLGLGFGLYIWARHEHRAMARQQAAKQAAKERIHRQKIAQLRHHLTVGKRRRLDFSFTAQKRRFLLFKTRPTLRGWIQDTPAGMRFLIAQGRKVMILTDGRDDGLKGKDLVGLVRKEKLLRRDARSHGKGKRKKKARPPLDKLLQPIEHAGPFKKRRYKKLYNLAFLAAMRALHADRQHLRRVTLLRRSHPARITLTKRQRKRPPSVTKDAWWAFWKRGPKRIKLQPSPQGLALIYDERKRSYGCKRKLLTLWKKRCKGTETIQRLFFDAGAPGLNPDDGDRHGVRVLRDGKLVQSKDLKAFASFPERRQRQLRETYEMLIELTADALQTRRPKHRSQAAGHGQVKSPESKRPGPRVSAPPSPHPRRRAPASTRPAPKAPQGRNGRTPPGPKGRTSAPGPVPPLSPRHRPRAQPPTTPSLGKPPAGARPGASKGTKSGPTSQPASPRQ